MKNDAVILGHSLLAVERFRDDTRHMVIYDVLDHRAATFGNKGERYRQFLTDGGYAAVQEADRQGYLRVRQHAAVIEGHILPEVKPKKRRPNK